MPYVPCAMGLVLMCVQVYYLCFQFESRHLGLLIKPGNHEGIGLSGWLPPAWCNFPSFSTSIFFFNLSLQVWGHCCVTSSKQCWYSAFHFFLNTTNSKTVQVAPFADAPEEVDQTIFNVDKSGSIGSTAALAVNFVQEAHRFVVLSSWNPFPEVFLQACVWFELVVSREFIHVFVVCHFHAELPSVLSFDWEMKSDM